MNERTPIIPGTIVISAAAWRDVARQARANDPAAIFRAAKRFTRQAATLRERGSIALSLAARQHAKDALARALELIGR